MIIDAKRIQATFLRNMSVRIPAGMFAIPDEIDWADEMPPMATSDSPSVALMLGIMMSSAP